MFLCFDELLTQLGQALWETAYINISLCDLVTGTTLCSCEVRNDFMVILNLTVGSLHIHLNGQTISPQSMAGSICSYMLCVQEKLCILTSPQWAYDVPRKFGSHCEIARNP